jgi:membrane associated rhomboid family serine protease
MEWGKSIRGLCAMDQQMESRQNPEVEWRAIPSDLCGERGTAILSERGADLWALVLASRYVPFRVERSEAGWSLLVPDAYYDTAREELRLFDLENRNWPPPAPISRPLADNTLATLSILFLVATFHNLTLLDYSFFGHAPIDWIGVGSADAARILNGQWWRTVTALTLHSGLPHLLGNLTIGGVFIVCLCRDLGSGLAWCLLLASGILGNLVNSWVQFPSHSSVGASTLVFGAVGILASLRLLRDRRHLQRRWPLPLAGAVALLAILGTEGERTDLGAHLFGFAIGIILGVCAEYLVEKHGLPGRRLNILLAFLAAAVPVIAWWAALVFS